MKTIGFIGCGNMGSALARAVAQKSEQGALLFCDTDVEKAKMLSKELDGEVVALPAVTAKSDILFLGVKPQGLSSLAQNMKPTLQARETAPVLVSMAAGIDLATLATYFSPNVPTIRIMPNLPVAVGAGIVLYCANAAATVAVQDEIAELLSGAGMADRISESLLDAAGALYGCGPAFAALFVEALADGAVRCGLPREKALVYAEQTLSGTAQMLLQTKVHPGAFKDAVCSPGGTTIAGVQALEEGGFRATAMNAVIQAYLHTSKVK